MLKLHQDWLRDHNAVNQGKGTDTGIEYEIYTNHEGSKDLADSCLVTFEKFGRTELQVEVRYVEPELFVVLATTYDSAHRTVITQGNCICWSGVLDAELPLGAVGIKDKLNDIDTRWLPFVGMVISIYKRLFPSTAPYSGYLK